MLSNIEAILQPAAMRAFMEDDNKYMMLDAPHAVEGWNGMSWSRDLGGNDSEMAVVYNNQVAATDKTFNKVYMLSAVASADGESVMGAYTLIPADDGKYIMVAGLPTNINHPEKMIGATNGVPGTFRGVSGVFKSSGDSASDTTAVSITITADGAPTWTDDGDSDASLTFTPDDPMALIMEPGRNYVSLGWWLTTNKMADGSLDSVDVRVAAFAMGSEYNGAVGTNPKNIVALVGLAKFMGIAAGKYAYSTTTSAGATAHEAGHFTAGATLTAAWGNADDELGTVTGTISDFEENGQSLGSWKVDLAADYDTDRYRHV